MRAGTRAARAWDPLEPGLPAAFFIRKMITRARPPGAGRLGVAGRKGAPFLQSRLSRNPFVLGQKEQNKPCCPVAARGAQGTPEAQAAGGAAEATGVRAARTLGAAGPGPERGSDSVGFERKLNAPTAVYLSVWFLWVFYFSDENLKLKEQLSFWNLVPGEVDRCLRDEEGERSRERGGELRDELEEGSWERRRERGQGAGESEGRGYSREAASPRASPRARLSGDPWPQLLKVPGLSALSLVSH